MDAEGRQLPPRFLPDTDANGRFNSARRTIMRELDAREAAATVGKDKTGGYQVVDASLLRDADKLVSESGSNATELRATGAIISPVNTPLGPLFLTLGLEGDSIHLREPEVCRIASLPGPGRVSDVQSQSHKFCHRSSRQAGYNLLVGKQ